MELADNNIKEKLADDNHEIESCTENKFFHEDILLDEKEEEYFNTEVPESDDYTEEVLDSLIGENIILQHNGHTVKSNIMKYTIGPDGKPVV